MKKALATVLILSTVLTLLTACGQQSATSETTADTTTSATDVTDTTETSSAEDFEPVVIDMSDFINEEANYKPIVKIRGDEGKTLFSFDFSEMATTKVEVTIDEKVEDDSFYVTMAGNVTAHTLVSDGSMFDGLAEIENGKAEFSVTYEDKRKINFVINVPNA